MTKTFNVYFNDCFFFLHHPLLSSRKRVVRGGRGREFEPPSVILVLFLFLFFAYLFHPLVLLLLFHFFFLSVFFFLCFFHRNKFHITQEKLKVSDNRE